MNKQIIKSNAAFVAIGDPDMLASRTRTNLCPSSKSFQVWGVGGLASANEVISFNTEIAPDGSLTADKVYVNTAITASSAYLTLKNNAYSPDVLINNTYTFSVYAKPAGLNGIRISANLTTRLRVDAYFNFSGDGSVAYQAIGIASIQKLNDGWFRCIVTTNISATSNGKALPRISLTNGQGTTIIDFDGSSGVILWGAQLEKSSFATNLLETNDTSITTVTEYIDRSRLFSLAQNCNFSVSSDRQNLKQIGSQNYIVNNLIKAPSVNLSFDYYLSPYLNNELLMGFQGNSYADTNAFNGLKYKKNNFYIVIDPEDLSDGFDQIKKSNVNNANFNGFNVLSFGDCYLNKYSLGFSLGQLPIVNTNFVCNNMKIDTLSGNNMINVPSLNQNGTENTSGKFDIVDLYSTIISGYISNDPSSRTEYNPPVSTHHKSVFSLTDLQIGGVPLNKSSNPILQSMGISFDFNRVDLYGLGNNYPYNRKLQYPINAQINIDALVSGYNTGFLSGLLTNESGYDFSVAFAVDSDYITGNYKFKNAKLDNFSYSTPVNNITSFRAAFSVEITDTKGFYMNRSTAIAYRIWNTTSDLWQNLDINWNSV